MFNVFHVVVGDWHAGIAKFIDELLLGVLTTVSNSLVEAVELLPK